MSGKGPASGFDYQSRVNAFVAVHILARRPLRWTQIPTADVPIAIRSESGSGGDDMRVELAGSEIVYECQVKRSLSADKRLDEGIDLFATTRNRENERGIVVVDAGSASTIRVGLREGLDHWRQGIRDRLAGALKRVIDRLRSAGAEAVADRLYIQTVDVELDAAEGTSAVLGVLERLLADTSQADAAWAVLVADGLRLCREGGRRTYELLVALLGQANIQLVGAPSSTAEKVSEMHSMLERLVASSTQLSSPDRGVATTDGFTVQLDTAKQLIDQGRYSGALEFLQGIAPSMSQAANSTRARLHNLSGVALYHLGRLEEARAAMLLVLDIDPNEKTALANVAQVELISGAAQSALSYALRAIEVDPESSGAWVVRVQLEPSVAVPENLAASPGILTARGVLAVQKDEWDEAVSFLRAALVHEAGSETALLLAQALYARTFEVGDASTDRADLDEALELLDNRLLAVRDHQPLALVERALLTRGQIHRLLGNLNEAVVDFSSALDAAPQSAHSAHMAALAQLDLGEPAKALFIVERVSGHESAAQLQLIRARALIALDRRTDAVLALEKAVNLCSTDADSSALLVAVAEIALETDAIDVAERAIAKANPDEWLSALFDARVAAMRGDDDRARASFQLASDSAPPRDATLVKAEFASYLRGQGDASGAVVLLEQVGAADKPELRALYARSLYEAREMVRAAALLDRVKTENAELPRWALHLGANIALASDDLSALIEYLEQFHARAPEENEVSLRLAIAYLRAHRPADTLLVLDQLRQRVDVSPRQLLHIAELYIRAGRPDDAVPLAYQALRMEPDAEDIQLAYLSIFQRRENEQKGLEADRVALNTAVELKTDQGQELRYFIVSGSTPRRDAGEIAADDAVAQDLLGKAIGDSIVLRPGSLSQATATISAIKTDLVHAYQEIFRRFPERHPQSVALQSFKIPDKPTIEDFAPITKSLKARAEHAKVLLDQYAAQGLPLGILAQVSGGTLVDAYWMVATSQAHSLLSEFSDSEREVIDAARSDRPIVVTRTALVTLDHLEIFDSVTFLGRRVVVPRSLIDEMDEERRHLVEDSKRGYLGIVYGENGPISQSAPPEYFVAALKRFDRAARWIQEQCEVLPRPLRSLENDDDEIREALGDSSADSLALTDDLGGELLADDLGLRRLHIARTKRLGFSTYALLLSLRGTVLPAAAVDRYLAELVRLRQTAIRITPTMIAAGFAAGGYKLDKRVLLLLEPLRNATIPLAEVIMFVVATLVEIAVTQGGRSHVGSAAYALVEAAATGRNAVQLLAVTERVARARMQLLPEELDATLAAFDRYSRFSVKRLPAVLPPTSP